MYPPAFTRLKSFRLFESVMDNHIYPRRLLLQREPSEPVAASPAASNAQTSESNFDANVITILAVLLCALICALGLNSIVRCVLRCSTRMAQSNVVDGERYSSGGVKKKTLKALPTLTYSEGLNLPGSGSCAICLSEFDAGERVRVLPKCNHGFHANCVDPWLAARSSCPTCRRCLSTAVVVAPSGPVVISPLNPEDPLYNYRGHH